MHPWHDVKLEADVAEGFPAIIETPAGSRVQYEVDPTTGLLRVKRVLFSAVHYPANYGFIPRTVGADGDGMDVLVLGQEAVRPRAIVRARAIGLLRMLDGDRRDDKVIAIHRDDPAFAPYTALGELPEHWLKLVRQFFEDYRALEKQHTVVEGYEGTNEANAAIRAGQHAYAKRFR
jgi:inorganic pyrophosphatase